jgi:hypothetical protein
MAWISKGAPVPDLSRVIISLADEPLNVEVNARIERAMVRELPRGYLGASAVGHECMRQTQYAWWSKPRLPARVRSIFDRGHYFEAYTRQRLIDVGFVFAPKATWEFIALNGDLQGHADGVLVRAPHLPGVYLPTPCVWEHKAINSKNFRALVRDGFARTFSRYGVQVALYQRFLDKSNPALISVVNADTCETLHFTLPYDARLAETWVERAAGIIAATRRGELLDRFTTDPDDWRCGLCEFKSRCWGNAAHG